MSNTKTRQQTPLEYLESLQMEWWICNLRRKIYKEEAEKRKFGKIATLKKNRIIEFCNRNEMPHIFGDQELMKKLNQKFSQQGGGCPTFEGRVSKDVASYYMDGADVRCFFGFTEDKKPIVEVGKVKKLYLTEEIVEIIFKDETTQELEFKRVSRIF